MRTDPANADRRGQQDINKAPARRTTPLSDRATPAFVNQDGANTTMLRRALTAPQDMLSMARPTTSPRFSEFLYHHNINIVQMHAIVKVLHVVDGNDCCIPGRNPNSSVLPPPTLPSKHLAREALRCLSPKDQLDLLQVQLCLL